MDRDEAAHKANEVRARLLAFVQGRMGSAMKRRFNAEDVVQSALLSFFGFLTPDNMPGSDAQLEKLLFLFTKRKMQKRFRDAKADKRDLCREEQQGTGARDDERMVAQPEEGHWGPEDEAIYRELEQLGELWRQGLSPLRQQVITLKEQGKSQGEIAAQIGRSDRAVRRYLAEAEAELRALIDFDRASEETGEKGRA